MYGLKKWEIALACALLCALLLGPVLGDAPCYAWWGVVYPELTPGGGMQSAAAAPGGVQLRLHTLEWLGFALRALGLGQR